MIDSFYIAWRFVTFNKARTATLIACVTLIAVLPLTLELLLSESEQQLLSRAESTPLMMGARGSALDLVMNALYFDDEVPELVSMHAVDWTTDGTNDPSGPALADCGATASSAAAVTATRVAIRVLNLQMLNAPSNEVAISRSSIPVAPAVSIG